MIEFTYLSGSLIAVSIIVGIMLTLLMGLKIKRINPNLYYTYRIYKENQQRVLNFGLLYTMLGWAFAFGAVAFAIGNLTIFMIYNSWIFGELSGKFFITTAIAAGVLFYFQKYYYFIKDNST